MLYRFDQFELDTDLFELRENGQRLEMEPMVFDLLSHLARHPDQVFSHQQLIDSVWAGRIVSDSTIATCVKNARRALGDSGTQQVYVKTVRGRGFRFSAQVREIGGDQAIAVDPADAPSPASADMASATTPEHSIVLAPFSEQTEPPEAAISGPPTIAVLPLQNLSPDPNHFLFGDAIAQEIIVDLCKLHWLHVVARGSSFQFRDETTDLAHISQQLGARYIVSGSIEMFGEEAVVSVEFSLAPESRVLWAERFECKLEELLTLRHAICARIVTEIESRVQRVEADLAARLPTENLDAWSAYHRGLWHMFRFNQSDNTQALAMFERARELDTQFARAYAGLSFAHFQNAFLRYSTDLSQDRRLAQEYAQKGLALDAFDPFINLTMGRSAWLDGSLESAGAWLDRSLELSPNYAFAMYNRALIDVLNSRGAESEDSVSKAMVLSPIDPLNYAMFSTRAMSHLVRREYAQATPWVERAIQEPTAHVHILMIAALTHQLAGGHERAAELATKVRQLSPQYTRENFFASFQFRNPQTLSEFGAACEDLGL